MRADEAGDRTVCCLVFLGEHCLKALVVDDTPVVARVLECFLRECGVDVVVTARDASEAMAELKKQPDFDVVFLDLILPDMPGWHVLNWLSQRQQVGSQTQVILMSGEQFSGDEQGRTNGNVTAVLNKGSATLEVIRSTMALVRERLRLNTQL